MVRFSIAIMTQEPSPLETLSGIVERVTFHNEENGFCVLRLQGKKQKELITVIGYVPMIASGEFIQASGAWIHDRQHGLQFKAELLKVTPPTTLEGIEKYLGSGLIKGIGPVSASKLVKAFGKDVFSVIEAHPERLRDVLNLSASRSEKILNEWSAQKAIRDIMLFLHSHQVSTARAVRIYQTYGFAAIQIITENPYKLAKDIRGIGFLMADKIAQQIGISRESIIRAQAGIDYALTKAKEDGHCGLPHQQLIASCQELLEVPELLIEQALALELENKSVIQECVDEINCIFLKQLYYEQKTIAERLVNLSKEKLPWPHIDAEAALTWVEQRTLLLLSETQKKAVTQALASKILIITGGPGVGKTTLVNSILKILQARDVKILLAAPTGRAAKRLSESTGAEAKTIHRLLETNSLEGHFNRDENFPLDCDLLVVDEVSMVDVPLMHALVKAMPSHAALILVGDVDQLPSVGPGQVLNDLIESKAFPAIRLTEVFRQAATSQIITTSHRINQGLMPEELEPNTESDFYFINVETPEIALAKILGLVCERIPQKFSYSPLTEIQVLSPMNRGVVGTRNLNIELQKIIKPPTEKSILRSGWHFSVGDKVMQTENDYDKEVYNGDLGVIKTINAEDSEVTITFDKHDVHYSFDELDQIVLAYATTIHKSQGSEYPVVVIPLMMQHYTMLQRNLIYTAITRGKNLVILVGQKKALSVAIQNKNDQKRWSNLKEKIKHYSQM